MKKEFYNSEELDLKSNLNSELSTRIFSPNYSLSELAENDESNILMEDEENIGCLLESRPEDDIIDFFGNKIIDDHWSKYKIEVSVSVDISLYPLKENFITPIDDFIASLQKYENIEVRTNSISTQLFGEYDTIMDILKKEISKTFDIEKNVVLNVKIVNGDSRLYD